MHRAVVAQAAESLKQTIIQSEPELLRAHFRRRFGLEPAGPEALTAVLKEPLARWMDLDAKGALVRAGIEGMFARMCECLSAQPVQVWHVPTGMRLLISDSSAVPVRLAAPRAVQRVAIAESDVIVMPMASDCLVMVGPQAIDSDSEMSAADVRLWNTLQVKTAHRYVYYHPRSGLGGFVRNTLGLATVGSAQR